MALAFVNSRPFVTSNIIGATNMEQLKTNIASVDIALNGEELEAGHAGHADVGQHEIRAEALHELQGVLGAGSGFDLVAVLAQPGPQYELEVFFVVDDQDPTQGHPALSSRAIAAGMKKVA